jgi:hypothetical protein
VKYTSIADYGYALDNNARKYYLDMSEYYKIAEDILKEETGKNLDESIKQQDPQLSETIKQKATIALVDKIDKEFLGGAMSDGMREFLISNFSYRLGYPRLKNIREFHFLFLKRMIHLVVTSDEFMVE